MQSGDRRARVQRLLRDVVGWGGWSTDGKYLLAAHAPTDGSNEPAGLIALTPAGEAVLVAPFTGNCPPSTESTCFKDLGWGQSRP